MTRHSKERALDDREFELFLEGCRRIPCDMRSLEAQFVAFAAGRLGLRRAEICHIAADWVDWRRRRICVPFQQDCHEGIDGELCGSCRQAAKQRVAFNQLDPNEARLAVLKDTLGSDVPGQLLDQIRATLQAAADEILDEAATRDQLDRLLEATAIVRDADAVLDRLDRGAEPFRQDHSIDQESAEELMWQAKTPAAAREVPFDFSARAEICIERYFDRFDGWSHSATTLGRRVDEALELADELDVGKTSPHGLRATAASFHAGQGVRELALQAMFGWSDISTARYYVATSPENTQRELHQSHGR